MKILVGNKVHVDFDSPIQVTPEQKSKLVNFLKTQFEIVEEKLKEMAKEEAKKFRHKVLKLFGFKTAWLYYNKFGHFHVERTPFGNWYKKHPWYKSGFSDPERYSWYVFKPERSINEVGDASVFPPNALRLLNEVFEKRYGAK